MKNLLKLQVLTTENKDCSRESQNLYALSHCDVYHILSSPHLQNGIIYHWN